MNNPPGIERRLAGLAGLALFLAACAPTPPAPPDQQAAPRAPVEPPANPASPGAPLPAPTHWLGYREQRLALAEGLAAHGRATASGEPHDMYAFTLAHPFVPLGVYLILQTADGKKVVARVNDRAPDEILRLSRATAEALGLKTGDKRKLTLMIPDKPAAFTGIAR